MNPQAAIFAIETRNWTQIVEARLERLLPEDHKSPSTLHRAMRHAVLGGGKRLRPRVLLSVADACGASEADRELALLAACAIELIHCASLVHDDLPCFDDADTRRGRPTVHVLFGEAMATLTGDALIVLAFEAISCAAPEHARRALAICRLLARAAGAHDGLVGGQSLEDDPEWVAAAPEHLVRYHAMKTAALFQVAAEAGAIATGALNVGEWGAFGRNLGLAYQLVDDLQDVSGDAAALGKPVGQDVARGRPNAALAVGRHAAHAGLQAHLDGLRDRIRHLTDRPAELLGLVDRLAGVARPSPDVRRRTTAEISRFMQAHA